jgi:hypothetical protein
MFIAFDFSRDLTISSCPNGGIGGTGKVASRPAHIEKSSTFRCKAKSPMSSSHGYC